jgi:hypothetical protein
MEMDTKDELMVPGPQAQKNDAGPFFNKIRSVLTSSVSNNSNATQIFEK